jgi:hypothetical protein
MSNDIKYAHTMSIDLKPSLTMSSTFDETTEPQKEPLTSHGLHLVVNFLWTKFRNEICVEAPDGSLTPLYTMHFRNSKSQLLFERAADKTHIATSTLHLLSADGDCIINGQETKLKLREGSTAEHNYTSHALDGVPVSWVAHVHFKEHTWVCTNAATQEPIARFSIHPWHMKQIADFYFEKSAEELDERLRDEVVVTGLTILYIHNGRGTTLQNLLDAKFPRSRKADEGAERAGEGGSEK